MEENENMSIADRILSYAGLQRRPAVKMIIGSDAGFSGAMSPLDSVLDTPDRSSAYYGISEWWKKEEGYLELATRMTVHDINFICANRLGDMASTASLLLFPEDAPENPITGMPDPELAIPRQDHEFYKLWEEPNPTFTSAQLKKLLVITYMISTNGVFLHIDDGSDPSLPEPREGAFGSSSNEEIPVFDTKSQPVRLWPKMPPRMGLERENDAKVVKYFTQRGQREIEARFTPESMMWLRNVNPINYLSSMSVSQVVRPLTMFDMLATDTTTDIFRNGLRTSAILEADRDYFDTEEFAKIEAFWKERAQGKDKWNGVLPLWGGFRLNKAGLTPHEANYIEGTDRAHLRIIAAWGMHPALIFPITNGRYLFKQAENYVKTTTLQPILNGLAQAITNNILRKFYPDYDGKKVKAYFTAIDALQDEIMIKNRENRAIALATSLATIDALRRTFVGDDVPIRHARQLGLIGPQEEIQFQPLGLYGQSSDRGGMNGGNGIRGAAQGAEARSNRGEQNADIITADELNQPLTDDGAGDLASEALKTRRPLKRIQFEFMDDDNSVITKNLQGTGIGDEIPEASVLGVIKLGDADLSEIMDAWREVGDGDFEGLLDPVDNS